MGAEPGGLHPVAVHEHELLVLGRSGRPVRHGTSKDAYETMRLVFGIYAADEILKRQRTARSSRK
jgi:hypothetical protein